ncbi:hypothetical protein F2Q69_00048492 [Brassica cretica]|uniref:Uncharacterized protein n=1 Tax=Brassica cretica TaxID=69181 RepID=A0A8S9PQ23_BRACR|nr:hypothetical protein F2Q69_00048492 [Brassica cretica]
MTKTPPRLTRRVSQRGEELLKAQSVSGPAFVSVTKIPPLLPSKPEPPDLIPVEQIEPLLEALSLHLPEALSPPEPPDPPDVPSDIGFLLLFDPPDVLFLIAPFFDTSFRPSPQAFIQISTLKPPSRMATKNGGGGGAHVSASETSFAYGLLYPVVYIFRFVDRPSLSSCFDHPAAYPRKYAVLLQVPYRLLRFCISLLGGSVCGSTGYTKMQSFKKLMTPL